MPKAKQKKLLWQGVFAKVRQFLAEAKRRLIDYMGLRPYRSFRKGKVRVRPIGKPLPSIPAHLLGTLAVMRDEKKNLFLLTVLYATVTFLVVGGLAQDDFVSLKDAALQFVTGDVGAFGTVTSLFFGVLSNAATTAGTELQQFLSGLILVIFWLATIWLVRMRLAGNKVRVRDALYSSGGPIVPTIMVMGAMAVQLLPAILGIFVYSVAVSEGFLYGGVESMMFAIAAGLLCLISLYWVSASFIALVMVSLPQTYPWQALAASSQLVIGQRWKLAKHIVALIVIALLLWVIVLFPSLFLDGWLRWDWLPLVPVVSQLLTAITLIFSTVYVYKLYRSLL